MCSSSRRIEEEMYCPAHDQIEIPHRLQEGILYSILDLTTKQLKELHNWNAFLKSRMQIPTDSTADKVVTISFDQSDESEDTLGFSITNSNAICDGRSVFNNVYDGRSSHTGKHIAEEFEKIAASLEAVGMTVAGGVFDNTLPIDMLGSC